MGKRISSGTRDNGNSLFLGLIGAHYESIVRDDGIRTNAWSIGAPTIIANLSRWGVTLSNQTRGYLFDDNSTIKGGNFAPALSTQFSLSTPVTKIKCGVLEIGANYRRFMQTGFSPVQRLEVGVQMRK